MTSKQISNKRHFQTSMMAVFREAAEKRDSSKDATTHEDEAKTVRVLNERSKARRVGMTQNQLKENLARDMVSLMNSINMNAAQDLSDYKWVAKSVVNYGLEDLSSLTPADVRSRKVLDKLREALVNNEPRLIPGTVQIEFRDKFLNIDQKVAFDIIADMSAKPADVPLEFVAELDVSAGNIQLQKTRGT